MKVVQTGQAERAEIPGVQPTPGAAAQLREALLAGRVPSGLIPVRPR